MKIWFHVIYNITSLPKMDSFRAVRASKTKSEDLTLKRASPGFGFRQRMCNFLAGSRRVQISWRDSYRDTRREFFPGRIPPGKRATSARSRRDPGE